MAPTTLWRISAAYPAVDFAILWLTLDWDMVSGLTIGGFIAFVLTLPIAVSFTALLAADAAIMLDVPWPLASRFNHFLHETTHGAILLVVGAFFWFWAVVYICVTSFVATLSGGNTYSALLGLIAKIPLIGSPIAAFWYLTNVLLLLAMLVYVIFVGVSALIRLFRTQRTGYVENGVPLHVPKDDDDDDDVEGGNFERWESNQG